MRTALSQRAEKPGFRVIPVLLPGWSVNDSRDAWPVFLKRLSWVQFRSGAGDGEAFRRLICGVRGEMPGPGEIQREPPDPALIAEEAEDIAWQSVPLQSLVEEYCERTGRNGVMNPCYENATVSASGHLPWLKALFKACQEMGIEARHEGNVTRFWPKALLETEAEVFGPVPLVGRPASIDVEDAPIKDVLFLIAKSHGMNGFISSRLPDSCSVSLRAKSVPVKQLLDLICRLQALECKCEGDAVYVQIPRALRGPRR